MIRLAPGLLLGAVLLGCGSSGSSKGSGGDGGSATTTSADGGSPSNGGGGSGGHGGSDVGGHGGGLPNFCTGCGTPKKTGTLAAPGLVELSGLAASAINPGAFFAENDSGNPASVFAIDETGKDLGEYTLTGATNVDWEDLARGPCPAGSCIYVGDIGDNAVARTSYALYRFTEPSTVAAGKHPIAQERFPFVYPDGSHNAETLLVDPKSGEVAIVTKVTVGKSRVYVFPLPLEAGVEVTLIAKGELLPPLGSTLFTGGDVHPAGRGVLLRTYSSLYFYAKDGDESIADALARAPCQVPSADEQQGEAVGWNRAGDGYVTSSEGAAAPIFTTSCE